MCMDFIHHQRGILWNLSLKSSLSTTLISCFAKSIQANSLGSRERMSWYSANRAWAAAWFLSDHLSRPDKSSCWKSNFFLCSTIILFHWIPCISSSFCRVLGVTSTGGVIFTTTTWVTLTPLAIVIGAAIKFFTTTRTHLLPEITCSLHSSHEASGVHHPLSGIELITCMLFSQEQGFHSDVYYFGQKSIHFFFLCCFDCLI